MQSGLAKDKKKVTVRTVKMSHQTASDLRIPSKFNRSADYMNELRQEGIEVARAWLARWPHDVGTYRDDAGY